FPHNNHSALIYKSTDGVTWTLLDEAHSPLFGFADGEIIIDLLLNGGILYASGPTTFPDTFDPNSNMKTAYFDPINGLWSTIVRQTIISGDTSDFLNVPRWFSIFRPDGSYLIATQSNIVYLTE